MSSRRREKKAKEESSSSSDSASSKYRADYDAFMHSIGRKGTSHRAPTKTLAAKPKQEKSKEADKQKAAPVETQPVLRGGPLPASVVHLSSGKRTSLLGVPDPSSAAK